MERPCKRMAHRSGQNPSAAPATAASGTGTLGSIMCFFRHTAPLPPSPKHMYQFFFLDTQLFSSSWTNRGHRCRPFSPPVLAFNFLQFLSRRGSSNPTACRFFIECCHITPRRVHHPGDNASSNPKIITPFVTGIRCITPRV